MSGIRQLKTSNPLCDVLAGGEATECYVWFLQQNRVVETTPTLVSPAHLAIESSELILPEKGQHPLLPCLYLYKYFSDLPFFFSGIAGVAFDEAGGDTSSWTTVSGSTSISICSSCVGVCILFGRPRFGGTYQGAPFALPTNEGFQGRITHVN